MERARALKLLRLADPFDQEALDQAFEQRKKSIHPDFLADLDTAYDFLLMGLEEEEVSIPEAAPEAPPSAPAPPAPVIDEVPPPVVQETPPAPIKEDPLPPPVIPEPPAAPVAPKPDPLLDQKPLPVLKPKKKKPRVAIWLGLLSLIAIVGFLVWAQGTTTYKVNWEPLPKTKETRHFDQERNAYVSQKIYDWTITNSQDFPSALTSQDLEKTLKNNMVSRDCGNYKKFLSDMGIKNPEHAFLINRYSTPAGSVLAEVTVSSEDCPLSDYPISQNTGTVSKDNPSKNAYEIEFIPKLISSDVSIMPDPKSGFHITKETFKWTVDNRIREMYSRRAITLGFKEQWHDFYCDLLNKTAVKMKRNTYKNLENFHLYHDEDGHKVASITIRPEDCKGIL